MAPVYSCVVARPTVKAVESAGGGSGGPNSACRVGTAGCADSPAVEEGPALTASIGEGGRGGRRWYTVS
jgi:hypothetical protein